MLAEGSSSGATAKIMNSVRKSLSYNAGGKKRESGMSVSIRYLKLLWPPINSSDDHVLISFDVACRHVFDSRGKSRANYAMLRLLVFDILCSLSSTAAAPSQTLWKTFNTHRHRTGIDTQPAPTGAHISDLLGNTRRHPICASSSDMAKSIPGTLLAPATSSSSHLHSPRYRSLSSSSSSSSSSRCQANIRRPAFSSSLLALLATVAASSSSADGRPLSSDSHPPDFLCPLVSLGIETDSAPPSESPSSCDGSSYDDVDRNIYHLSPFPTRNKRSPPKVGYIPDKYVQGVDDRWRKESSWSLYGSTYCEVRRQSACCLW